MNMPVVSPLSLWKETGRENIDVLLKFKTRAGIDAVINPTHEEIITDYVRSILQSYKQLPLSPNSLCLFITFAAAIIQEVPGLLKTLQANNIAGIGMNGALAFSISPITASTIFCKPPIINK